MATRTEAGAHRLTVPTFERRGVPLRDGTRVRASAPVSERDYPSAQERPTFRGQRTVARVAREAERGMRADGRLGQTSQGWTGKVTASDVRAFRNLVRREANAPEYSDTDAAEYLLSRRRALIMERSPNALREMAKRAPKARKVVKRQCLTCFVTLVGEAECYCGDGAHIATTYDDDTVVSARRAEHNGDYVLEDA